jgi:hypothetical protein
MRFGPQERESKSIISTSWRAPRMQNGSRWSVSADGACSQKIVTSAAATLKFKPS